MSAVVLLCALLVAPSFSLAACPPVVPVECPDCFAVFVMPDTQFYAVASRQPAGAAHLDLVTRYICDNETSWTEPTTGKQMPIEMVIQLGDLVHFGDMTEGPVELAEWLRVDAAFDNLDGCGVPYLVTTGNHDYSDINHYHKETLGYQTYFGTDRWVNQGYDCANPALCSGLEGDWFIGGGDPIAANSRNNIGGGITGPTVDYEGRHRAGVIQAPNGQRFLFLGLEAAFDFPPAAPGFEGIEGDDITWPQFVLQTYADLPTVVFHHSMLLTTLDPFFTFGIEAYRSDSIAEGPIPDGMIKVWNELIDPYPQVFAVFSGHVVDPSPIDDFTISRSSGPPVAGFLRNFQGVEIPAAAPQQGYGGGWNVIAVFDPELDEIRVRSYRIDDTDAYADPPIDWDHTGTPAATECLEVDWGGFGERVVPFDFEPPSELPALRDGRLLLLGLLVAIGLAFAVPRLTRSLG